MLRQDPSKEWESFGREDPYFGVCTEAQFRREELGEDARTRFFASGGWQIDELFADAGAVADSDFAPERVLEYGCGVGRLLIPAARHARCVVGVDLSPSMLAEARRNCKAFGATEVQLVEPDHLNRTEADFDFIYSIAVLQHIPRRAGEQIIGNLAGLLRRGGVGAINIVLRADLHLACFNAIMKVPLAHNAFNVVRRRGWSYPHMQMNVYDLNRVALILRDKGARVRHVKVGPKVAGFDPCTVFFTR